MDKRKYIFIILILSLCPKGIFAVQVEADTIISMFPQWKVGDKYYYRYTEQEATVAGEDTISGNSHSYEDFSLEIVSADSSGYVVKYTMLEHREIFQDSNGKEIELFTFPIPIGTEILFRTDIGGSLVDVIDWDGLSEKLSGNSPLSYITEGTVIDINKPNDIPLNRVSMVPDKETLVETLFYVTQLFMYNGQEFEDGGLYSWDDKFQSEWDDELIDMTAELIVGRNDAGNVVFYQNNIIDSDQLIDNYINYFSRFMDNPDALRTPERPYIFMETEHMMVIDGVSGVVISANYDRRNTQKNVTVVNSVVVERVNE